MAQKIQLRHDTAANWTGANPTLMVGEFGYETDTGQFKIGDGLTAWISLAYALQGSLINGQVPIAHGGTGQSTQQAAIDAMTGTQGAGKYLRSDGTHSTLDSIHAADVPTLNQNTTGTAASVTGSFVGDVTGTQGATVVSSVGGSTAANVHTAEVAANAATAIATASTIMKRDANANVAANNFNEGFLSTATAAGTTTLTVSSAYTQQFTGTSTQTVKLPDATTLALGQAWMICNRSTGVVTVTDNGGNVIQLMASGSQLIVTCASISSANGVWDAAYSTTSSGSGSGQGAKNYITNYNFEGNVTTGWRLVNTALDSNKNPTTVSNPGAALATAQYIFTITSGNATVGATYTNNSQTFTVVNTIAAKTILVCTGTGAPTASGTLTKTTGTGDATITFSAYKLTTAAATLSFTTTATNLLAGTYSGSLASSAATTAGDMLISDPFTIDQEDQAQMLAFLARYKLLSGTGVWAGDKTGTYAAWIYDVTNGAWIQPAGVYNFIQSSGVGKASGTFQTPSNGSQFQFAIVNINATSGAITTLVDDISVGPQMSSSGAAMSDGTTWTPVLNGSTTNVGLGTGPVQQGTWYRTGDRLLCELFVQLGTSPTAGAGNLQIPLPNAGWKIDTAKLGTSARAPIGDGYCGTGSSIIYTPLKVVSDIANQNYVLLELANAGGLHAASAYTTAVNFIKVNFECPIVGWSSNTVQSADTDTRLCEAKYQVSGAQAPGASLPINFAASVWDTHAAVTTGSGWKFVAPSTGYYWVAVTLAVASGTGPVSVYKNGVQDTYLFQATTTVASGSTKIKLNAGDYIDLRFDSALTTGSLVTANWVSISRDSGPAVVQASDSVNCSYQCNASQSITSTAVLTIFGTKMFDTHGAYNTSTGIFTAPVPGKYRISIQIFTITATSSPNNLNVRKNAALYQRLNPCYMNATNQYQWSGSFVVSLNSGDTLDLQIAASPAGSTYNSSVDNWFSIERIGN